MIAQTEKEKRLMVVSDAYSPKLIYSHHGAYDIRQTEHPRTFISNLACNLVSIEIITQINGATFVATYTEPKIQKKLYI